MPVTTFGSESESEYPGDSEAAILKQPRALALNGRLALLGVLAGKACGLGQKLLLVIDRTRTMPS